MNKRLALLSAIGFTFVLLALLSMSFTAQATPSAKAPAQPQALLLAEDFDYGAVAMSLTVASGGNWTNHSGASPYVGYTTTSLSMAGYGSSGIGGAATILTTGSEDANRTFITQTSGTVYYAVLMNVSSAGTGTYFLHLKDGGSNFHARIFARNDAGTLRFGLSDTSTGVYSTTANFSYSTTYLVVAKYNVDTGATALYVLDTFSATEPATALLTTTGTAQSVLAVAFRQVSGGPSAIIDGVRVANTWAEVVGVAPALEVDLSVAKSGPATASAGETITYTIAFSNTGTATASATRVTDTLPTEVSYVSYSASIPVTFTQPPAGTLVWDVGDIASSASGLITVEATISASLSAGTRFTNTVTASTTYTETSLGNNTAQVATLIGAPDLAVVKEGPAMANAGDTLTYTLTYSNVGGLPATSVKLVDQLPAGLAYVSDSGSGSVVANGVITWSVGTLNPGQSNSIVVTATASYAGDQANDVTISGLPFDSDLTNNTSIVTTTVNGVDPFVLKSGPAQLFGGEVVSYTITYGNYGNLPADVTITDTLPLSFTIVSDTSGFPAVDAANTRSWTTTIPANTTGLSFTLAVQVPLSVATGTRVTNTVTVVTSAAGNNPSDDLSQCRQHGLSSCTDRHRSRWRNRPGVFDHRYGDGRTWCVYFQWPTSLHVYRRWHGRCFGLSQRWVEFCSAGPCRTYHWRGR